MARSFYINGPNMVWVKGNVNSPIAALSELGLSEQPVQITPDVRHGEINLSAWGNMIPVEVQCMLAAINVSMTLIHFDEQVLEYCIQESMAGVAAFGIMPGAGSLLGNGQLRFAAGNHFIGLNIASPVGNNPWRFYSCYLTGQPITFPLGNERSTVQVTFRCIPYAPDPWNGGAGSAGVILCDHTLDN